MHSAIGPPTGLLLKIEIAERLPGRVFDDEALLYKAKKNRSLAVQHLTQAKRIFSQFGQTPILARVDAALAELG